MNKFIEKLPLIRSIMTGVLLILFFIASIFASELTIDQTKEMLEGDPYKIAQWMAQNIRGAKDDIGYAQPAERTFKYKKGDCEDWAILSRYFIGNKYETYLIIWQGKFREDSKYYKRIKRKISHCVVAFKMTENNWGIIDQDRFIPNGKSLMDIIKINCDLRRVNVEEAYVMDLLKLRRKIIEKIDLEE